MAPIDRSYIGRV